MKAEIHPKYHEKATIKCACGHTHTIGSTREKMTVEICSNCHPFYTGKEKLIDTAGRVEKFKSRQKKATLRPVRGTQGKQAEGKKPATKEKATPAPRRSSGQAKKDSPKKAAVKKGIRKSSSKRTTGREK